MKAILLSISILISIVSKEEWKPGETSQRKIQKVHHKAITIDSHTDTPMWFLNPEYSFGDLHKSSEHRSKIDIPRMQEGDLDAVFLAVFTSQGKRDSAGIASAENEARQVFDSIHTNLRRYSGKISLGLNSGDIERYHSENKITAYIGLENGYPLGRDLSMIDTFYRLGARYITLCHTSNNDICDSSTDPGGPEHNGLSGFGEKVIEVMNSKGIMIDVSHISDSAFFDVLKLSGAPVIASHSCSRAICDNPRNLTDDMLRELAHKGGVIQMCILSSYVKTPAPQPQRDSSRMEVRKRFGDYYSLDPPGKKKFLEAWYAVDKEYPPVLASVSDVVDHIDHIVEVAGINHVGIGTDFDGGGGVQGCYDISEIKNITAELLKRGYSPRDIKKIWGGNLIRVFREVEKFSLQHTQK